MVARRVMVLARDASSQQALERALGSGFDLVEDAAAADVVVAPLGAEGLAAMECARQRGVGGAEFVFAYAPDQNDDVAGALRGGAFYCVAEPLDVGVLRAVVARCLELRDLKRVAHAHAGRVERELARAARLQAAMLPSPEARLQHAAVSVALRCRPCAEVGGDLVDYAEADGRAAVVIADVAGHGVSAAMLTTLVKAAFVTSRHDGYAPAAVVDRLLLSLQPFEPGQFLTLICARLDPKRGTIEYVNAGHPSAIVFARGQVLDELAACGPPLMPRGLRADYPLRNAKLPPHCEILLYTDGVTECSGDEGRFGRERMLGILATCRGGGATLLERILASLDAFTTGHPVSDDVTLAAVTVGVPGLG